MLDAMNVASYIAVLSFIGFHYNLVYWKPVANTTKLNRIDQNIVM